MKASSRRRAIGLTVMAAAVAATGCGGGGPETGPKTQPPADRQTGTDFSVQPPAPCERGPSSVVSQIEQTLATGDAQLTVVQMVQSDESFEGGAAEPYFVAARSTIGDGLPVTGVWIVEEPGRGEPIPLDEFARYISTAPKGVDEASLEPLRKAEALPEARQCVGQAVSLRQRKAAQEEAARRQEQAQREQERAQRKAEQGQPQPQPDEGAQ